MPRLARTVCAHLPHHITQRGNRREAVFFSDRVKRGRYPLPSNFDLYLNQPGVVDALKGTKG